jgi:site-specific DNA-methyltransferase (cytosine-N4-specific)
VSLDYRIGDVFDRLAEIPDGSIDLIVTSPPFLALRSYLPADHPDKAKEIGSEPTPAEFIDTLLALTAEFGRVIAPHGSICVELGDTFAGSGGHSDTNSTMSAALLRSTSSGTGPNKNRAGSSWPLAKSLTGIPTLYPWSLAYGRNLLTGEPSPAGQWRIRNVIVWARPNPPVGALGDKFRPATSYITVACKGPKRYFDLDAVRTTPTQDPATYRDNGYTKGNPSGNGESNDMPGNPAGAPPLDWHADDHPEDGDWLWKLSTQPYKGSHYATYPLTLPKRMIEAMCPRYVCPACGPLDSNHDQSMRDLQGTNNQPIVVEGPGGQEEVLFSSVRDCGGTGGTIGEDSRQGLSAQEQAARLHRDPVAGPPDGGEVRLTVRASTGDGGTSRTDVDAQRGRTSQERHQGRQPNRKSRTTDEDGPRRDVQGDAQEGQPLSALRGASGGVGPCPHCGGPLRVGVTLDPFAGSGTTLEAAQAVGRHAIGIDIDARNAHLAQSRVGMFLNIDAA